MLFSSYKQISVAELKTYSEDNTLPLFPIENDMPFWAGYATNFARFDRYFELTFRSWLYNRKFPEDATVASIFTAWQSDIDAWLFINEKRLSELFQVQILENNAYSIVNNYDAYEETTRANTGTQTNAASAQNNSMTYGEKTDTETIGAFSDSITETHGEQGETDTQTEGSHTDGLTDTYASKQGQTTETHGVRDDLKTITNGEKTTTTTDKIAAFNSSDYENADKTQAVEGEQDITESTSVGQQVITTETEEGHHEDTHVTQYGEKVTTNAKAFDAYTDMTTTHAAEKENTYVNGSHSDSIMYGAKTDTRTDDLEETLTSHKYGNIGIQTAAQIIGGHVELWDGFNFYKKIFTEICRELLVLR